MYFRTYSSVFSGANPKLRGGKREGEEGKTGTGHGTKFRNKNKEKRKKKDEDEEK